MAEVIGTVTGTVKQSIARVELDTAANYAQDDWTLTIVFENALYDDQGKLLDRTEPVARRVGRRFGDIKNVQLTAAGTTVTVGQLAALIAAGAYMFRAEDVAAV